METKETQEITLSTECPECGHQYLTAAEIEVPVRTQYAEKPTDPTSPDVRSKIKPVGNVLVYRISSDDIKQFIIQKAMKYVPGIRVEVAARYIEKKKSKGGPHQSYASLRVAFSDDAFDKGTDQNWYAKLGQSSDDVRLVKSLFTNIVSRYSYDRKMVDDWLKDYKTMEVLEETFGMTEAYISDIRTYCTPQRISAEKDEPWVIFAAAPDKVINDMLTSITTNSVIGKIQIQDIYPISKDAVEYIIYVYPGKMEMKEDPIVRKVLFGEQKAKK